MSKKIVKCKICEKNITTRSKGKKFRHCGTDQLIKDTLISDLSREKPKKEIEKDKEEKQEIPKEPDKKQSESKEVKKEKEEPNGEKTKQKQRNSTEEEDWGF